MGDFHVISDAALRRLFEQMDRAPAIPCRSMIELAEHLITYAQHHWPLTVITNDGSEIPVTRALLEAKERHKRSRTHFHHVEYDRIGQERREDVRELCIRCHVREHPRVVRKRAA